MTRQRLAVVAALLMIFTSRTVIAANFEGAGLRLCADFTRDSRNADPSFQETIYFTWAEGFMSGLTIARLNDDRRMFRTMSREQQMAHIRTFCAVNPTAEYFKAVIDLYNALAHG